MHSQEAIQALIAARLASVREASEKRDVDALMSWHAKDAVFHDVGMEAEREPLTW
jgi:ketosteroid isomerase-like protein